MLVVKHLARPLRHWLEVAVLCPCLAGNQLRGGKVPDAQALVVTIQPAHGNPTDVQRGGPQATHVATLLQHQCQPPDQWGENLAGLDIGESGGHQSPAPLGLAGAGDALLIAPGAPTLYRMKQLIGKGVENGSTENLPPLGIGDGNRALRMVVRVIYSAVDGIDDPQRRIETGQSPLVRCRLLGQNALPWVAAGDGLADKAVSRDICVRHQLDAVLEAGLQPLPAASPQDLITRRAGQRADEIGNRIMHGARLASRSGPSGVDPGAGSLSGTKVQV